MDIKNIDDLEKQKAQLKSEVSEMESILSFKDPRKSFGVLTNGATEQFLGEILDSKVGKNVLPLAEKVLKGSVQLGSMKVIKDKVGSKITKPMLVKGLVGIGVLAAGVFLAKKAKRRLDEYQQRKVAESLNELI